MSPTVRLLVQPEFADVPEHHLSAQRTEGKPGVAVPIDYVVAARADMDSAPQFTALVV